MTYDPCPWCWEPLSSGETRNIGTEVHVECDERMRATINMLGLYAYMFNRVNGADG